MEITKACEWLMKVRLKHRDCEGARAPIFGKDATVASRLYKTAWTFRSYCGAD